MSTRDFSRGKGGRCVRLKTYHPRSAERHENLGSYPTRNPLGHLRLLRHWPEQTWLALWKFGFDRCSELGRRMNWRQLFVRTWNFQNLNFLHKSRNLHKHFTMSYGCDTWSLIVRENEGKFVSDWVLRRMSGLLEGEVRGWPNTDNVELCNFSFLTKYCYNDHFTQDEMKRACSMQGREGYNILLIKCEGETPLGRHRWWWDDIKGQF